MHKQMSIYLSCLLFYVTISLLFSPNHISYGTIESPLHELSSSTTEQWDDETKAILQSSLSIVEIDREIARLQQKLEQLELTLDHLDNELTIQEIALIEKKEAAGKVLRSYFMGERQELLFSLLNSRSLESFLKKLEFYELVMQHDQHIINSYKEQQKVLENQYATYIAEQIKVEQAKSALEAKREEVVKLEKEIDEKLASRDDREHILLLMDQLTKQWNEEGIEQIEHYLHLLNEAMHEFPVWLQNQTEYSKMKGLAYHIELPEQALNDFLREQDEAFDKFSFSFSDGQIIAKGKDESIEIELAGHYTIINEPTHFIQFTIDTLMFNTFALPQSSIDDLMSKYDLNFYPELIVSFLRASTVDLQNGYLYLQLKLKL